MIRKNPFDAVYQQINFLSADEKMSSLPDFPKLLDVELTNVCNFKCLMCPVGTKVQTRASGFMADSVFERVLEEAARYNTPIRFILWGEPTLHKNWFDYMTRAKKAGVAVHFNTNGSLLDEESMVSLVASGIDSIKFSFQGVDSKSYREMRNIEYFDTLLSKVASLHAIRGENPTPYIHVSTTITYEGPDQVREFKKRVEPITDKVTVGRTVLGHFDISSSSLKAEEKEMLSYLQEKESVVRERPQCCPEVYDKLSVHWDGQVSACCTDYDNHMIIGDISEESLADIWKKPKLQAIRSALAQGQFEKFSICKDCYDYHGLQTPGIQDK